MTAEQLKALVDNALTADMKVTTTDNGDGTILVKLTSSFSVPANAETNQMTVQLKTHLARVQAVVGNLQSCL